MTYRLSNLIMIQKKNNSYIEFRHLRIYTNDSTLCHPSCHGKCRQPFVVCSQKVYILTGFGLAFLSVAALFLLLDRGLTMLESCTNTKVSKRKKNFERALLKANIVDPDDSQDMPKL